MHLDFSNYAAMNNESFETCLYIYCKKLHMKPTEVNHHVKQNMIIHLGAIYFDYNIFIPLMSASSDIIHYNWQKQHYQQNQTS